MDEKKKVFFQRVLSIVIALALWQTAAGLLGQKILLVSPVEVCIRLTTLWTEEGFWGTVWFSLARIAAGFFLGLVTGAVLGVLSYHFHWMETLLWPYVVLAKSVPVASFIIISLVWLNAENLSVFISFLMVFPVVYFNILQGMRSVDRQKLEMAELFKIPWRRKLCYIYLPRLKPFILSACSVAIGMAWKAGVAAEVIGIPKGSMGERLYEAKVYLNTTELFAWTIVLLVLSVLFEKLFLKLLKAAFVRMEKK